MTDRRHRLTILALCFLGLSFEGYDLVVYGTVLPQLISSDDWNIGPTQAGLIGTVTVIGMLIGSIISGTLSDIIGRRRLTILSCGWFSVWMLASSAAPNAQILGGTRFFLGLGVGAFVPLIAALAVQCAPAGKGNRYSAIAWSGYPIGGVIAALIGYFTLEPLGERFLFALGGLPLLTVVPLMIAHLPKDAAPESPATSPAGTHSRTAAGVTGLFTRRTLTRTMLFGAISASGLILTYGLNTWLPQLMRANGYELGSALTFLIALNLGAAVVPPLLAKRADISGPGVVILCVFLTASASILALSVPLPILIVYCLVFIAGAGTLGAQLLLPGFVATDYPQGTRVAALSWISIAGRIGALGGPTLIGFLIASGSSVTTSFIVFAAFGILGAILTALLSRGRPPTSKTSAATAMTTEIRSAQK
ncbi:MFS transporter [Rhodococcus qingshengii]|uniref:MFS transporter n=1 Tax=Rhodococcus qingshengii TaxID=334542 RepID=A0AAW6LTY5_RHOSG|nr:MFS transporter [Rhodococcus qingshengii]MDE8649348.1 MFS transporter [Rhodococcus qingshengii]